MAESRLLEINGHGLEVSLQGHAGTTGIIFLHHGLGAAYSWKEQVQPMLDAGWQVLAYSRWGYGSSEARAGFSIPHFREDLDDLQALIDWAGFDRPVLVGHSDGGTISLIYAARNPQKVQALVTVAAHAYVEEKMVISIRALRDQYENSERFRRGMRRVHGEKAHAVFYGWLNGWLKAENRDWDIRHLLPAISCPALIAQGTEDEHALPQHAQDIAAAIPRGEIWLAEGANHMLPQEYAEPFNRRLLSFLEPIRAVRG